MFVRPELAQDPTISLAVPITWAMLSFLALIARHEAVRQRLHEAYERVLLCVREAQSPHAFRVHVGGRLRRGPTRRAFAGVVGLAARQDVPRVVEMHDRL